MVQKPKMAAFVVIGCLATLALVECQRSGGSNNNANANTGGIGNNQYDGMTDKQKDMVMEEAREALQTGGEYDPMISRIAPTISKDENYAITSQRLKEIRARLMYPYYDMDKVGTGGSGDLQRTINSQNTQVNKQLTFLLPYFGFALNYTWVSINGYIGFSNAPMAYNSYPLKFPIMEWPKKPDPSFMGIFYSKCSIGNLKHGEEPQQVPGVYWRLERDLPFRKDRIGVELRERITWDIRNGIIGSEVFRPKHLIIVTWKNVTFAGGYRNSKASEVTNTFQLLVVTDEVRSYAVFNYEKLNWISHTEAGGSADEGQGGTPAFIGFNAGNGTRSYEYHPYSQQMFIRDLASTGMANDQPGRHIFRIDEEILQGSCQREETLSVFNLNFSPDHANMMGGQLVNITGPCFKPTDSINCQFDSNIVVGHIVNPNRAVCITPQLFVTGYVWFAININKGQYKWRGRFLVETPLTTKEGVWFTDRAYEHEKVESLKILWSAGNLTQTRGATAQISLWGYKEKEIKPQLMFIDVIQASVLNDDREVIPYQIDTSIFANRDNTDVMDLEMGFIMINLTKPESLYGLAPMQTKLWSKPIPLAWYFNAQWTRAYGDQWPTSMCDRWTEIDRNLRNFAFETERCPCTMEQAVADKGRFLPDFSCNLFGNAECDFHYGAVHCVRSGLPNKDGAGQQCCYDRNHYLMMSADQMWAGNPHRAHNFGLSPYDQAVKVPSLSHWYYDVIPFFTCCKWQDQQSSGCTTFRFERRVSQDCVGYQPPGVATTFGDPHFYTFDGVQYTFNAKGEYVLVHVDSPRGKLDVQGRFEQVPTNMVGNARASMLTAVAARDNISAVVEISARPQNARWRYHLDVRVDGRRVYFDRYSKKIQMFKKCVIYTPSNVLNQSVVIVMFKSGAGVEVQENNGFLATKVYLPIQFANTTRGLFGNWSFRADDDFVLPQSDTFMGVKIANDSKNLFYEFGQKWVLDDKDSPGKGASLFSHYDGSGSSTSLFDPNFVPNFVIPPLLANSTIKAREVEEVCGNSYQCTFDFHTTLRRDFATMTKFYHDEFVNIKENHLAPVIPCGSLTVPPHGRKSTFNFMSGTEVKFDCDPGYVLLGEQRRWCYSTGDWNWPENGEATCVTEDEYQSMQAGLTTGTVLAVLLPVVMALACFAAHKRAEYMEEEYDDEEHDMKPTGGSRH